MNYREKYALAVMLMCILAGSLFSFNDAGRAFVIAVSIIGLSVFVYTPKG
jgi:hypothetical protein